MKHIFSTDLTSEVILNVILTGLVVFLIQKWFENRWLVKIEKQILENQNFVNNKKDTYLEAIDITLRYISFNYSGRGTSRQLGASPTHLEMNTCMTRLYIYSTNSQIPQQFRKVLLPLGEGEDIIIEFTNLLNLIGRDLGNEGLSVDFTDFKLIYPASSGKEMIN